MEHLLQLEHNRNHGSWPIFKSSPMVGLGESVSTECVEKVEAMLSTAVLHLADVWSMISLEFPEGVAFDPDTALLTTVAEIPPQVITAMKSKLESSLEWCHLARSRLTHITRSPNHVEFVFPRPTSTTTRVQDPPNSLWQKRSTQVDNRFISDSVMISFSDHQGINHMQTGHS